MCTGEYGFISKQIFLDSICKIFLKKNKDDFEHIFIFLLLLRLWFFEHSSDEFHLSLLCISKKKSLWKMCFFFSFNTLKASLIHKWKFHVVLWLSLRIGCIKWRKKKTNPFTAHLKFYTGNPCPFTHHICCFANNIGRTEASCKCASPWEWPLSNMEFLGRFCVFISHGFMKEYGEHKKS